MSFDRAADFYDATRRLPSDAHVRLTEILADELAGRGACLEIGVGTGRIALPLRRAGIPLVGTDIAPRMLRRLVDNAGDERPPPLAVADVGALPFRSAAFGAVLSSHVLHLITDWRAAVDEAVRVLRAGAVLLVDFGGNPSAPWGHPAEEVMAEFGVVRRRPGVSVPDLVAEHLAGRATLRPLPTVSLVVERTLAQDLADWEGQIHSWTWSVEPERMAVACAAVRRWAQERAWPLERRVELERTVRWWAFDLNAD
jgi:SAM-dependent methyltransferase